MGNLTNKTALVTGASRGIGRAIAERLAKEGAIVAVHYANSPQKAADVVAGIEATGGNAFTIGADLFDPAAPTDLFNKLDAELQRRTGSKSLDILVNNAGIAEGGMIDSMDETAFDRLFQLNVKSLFFVTQKAIPRLRDGGRVINLASVVTRVAYPGYSAYSATKGAVDILTRNMAAELGSRNITVNAVAPGNTETDMNPNLKTEEGIASVLQQQALKRKGQVGDIADVVAFLASPDSRWVTGQIIDASGGSSL